MTTTYAWNVTAYDAAGGVIDTVQSFGRDNGEAIGNALVSLRSRGSKDIRATPAHPDNVVGDRVSPGSRYDYMSRI